MRSSGRGMARAAEAGARFSGEVGRRVRERPAGRPSLRALPTPPVADPPLDGSREFADLYGEIPELSDPPQAPEPARRSRARGACCRRDRRRGDARHPRRAAPGASADSVSPASGEHPRPHQAGQRRRPGSRARGQSPHRGPGQLRSGGTRRGQGHGPACDALRAPAGCGNQGEPRLAAPRRPRLRARHDRDPDPRAHPRQAGGRRRGPQHLGEPGDARRHLPGRTQGGEPAHGVARQGHLGRRRGLRPGTGCRTS